MGRLGTFRSICRLGLLLALAGGSEAVVMAQSTSSATCTVRIRPREAADYDLSTEVTIQGVVEGWEGRSIRIRLAAGVLRVDTGAWNTSGLFEAGTPLEVLASRSVVEGRQRFLAREIRHAGGVLMIRDAFGAPIQAGSL
ncbi:MAG TPA: hypothetical protein VJ528_03565 [Geothrix sp.]|uniref:hypothetical protein n=1 Tax=Geothrix mesophila TaxID=2922723 RepID=UPI001FADFF62|nr:hypothetical protein [Geothrix sp. SG198]HJV37894.1 hypothetical protein [Geothrix sp.]